MENPLVYRYQPKWTTAIYGTLFFSTALVYGCFKASANDRGLTINGILKLSPEGATAFYWLMVACCFVFVTLGAITLLRLSSGFEERITLTESGIDLPPNVLGRGKKFIRYQSIRSIVIIPRRNGLRALDIRSPEGNACINECLLDNSKFFDQIYTRLKQHVPFC